jgi:hypothetical protein
MSDVAMNDLWKRWWGKPLVILFVLISVLVLWIGKKRRLWLGRKALMKD